jgi:glucosylceramidase
VRSKVCLWLPGRPAPPPSAPRAWITAGERRFDPLTLVSWIPSPNPAPRAVEIDPARRLQRILGFGGAFTGASCYLFSRMSADARHVLLENLLGPAGLRLSLGRTCIGSSDYSRTAYSYDDAPTPDPALERFSIHHDRAYILPTLREAIAVNPELFLFSAPWSPPGWMKANHSLLGGSMLKTYFAAYAQSFVRFLRDYNQAGERAIECHIAGRGLQVNLPRNSIVTLQWSGHEVS